NATPCRANARVLASASARLQGLSTLGVIRPQPSRDSYCQGSSVVILKSAQGRQTIASTTKSRLVRTRARAELWVLGKTTTATDSARIESQQALRRQGIACGI